MSSVEKQLNVFKKGNDLNAAWIIIKEALLLNEGNAGSNRLVLVDQNFFDGFTDGVVIVDKNLQVTYTNSAFARMLDISREELIGQEFCLYFHGIDEDVLKNYKEVHAEPNGTFTDSEPVLFNIFPFLHEGNRNYFLLARMPDASKAMRYKINLLNSKVAFYQDQLERVVGKNYNTDNIVGKSQQINAVRDNIRKMASSNNTIMLKGEEGVGKELMARSLHYEGPRRLAPFIKFQPSKYLGKEGEITGELDIEGIRKVFLKEIDMADRGTLYIEEVGHLIAPLQKDLLKLLQDKTIRTEYGSDKKVDVRIVVSTSCNLEEKIKSQQFSETLYFRLNVLSFSIPPLRDRKEDIQLLTDFFVQKYCSRQASDIGKPVLSTEAYDIMVNHHWPENINELKRVVECTLNAADGQVITPDLLPVYLRKMVVHENNTNNKQRLRDIMEETEKAVLLRTLQRTAGNKVKAAKLLGISRAGLYQKLEKYSLLDE